MKDPKDWRVTKNQDNFEYWHSGRQILAVRDHKNIYKFYVGLVSFNTDSIIFNKILRDCIDNYDLIKVVYVTDNFVDDFIKQNSYSSYALKLSNNKRARN